MGVLSKLLTTTTSTPQGGIANGENPGHIGIWVTWDTKSHPSEVFRVVIKAESVTGLRVDPATYTFLPGHDAPFCQSVETTHAMKEFLTGRYHATQGTVSVDFLLSGTMVLHESYSLEDFTKCLRGKGQAPPKNCKVIPGFLEKDKPEIAALRHAELKPHSEEIKRQLEEKRKKEEEERKAKEAAAEAAKKAAAAAASSSGTKAAAKTASDGPSITSGRVAIFYGSSTGNTEGVAKQIKDELGSVDHLKNVAEAHPLDFTACEIMILGIPTWHIGELQDDWAAILPDVAKNNYAGKKIAIFGLGDQKGYADTYVDAMADIAEAFEKTGAKLHGLWPTDGYDFKKSKALRDGKFMGVVIDVENQDNLSDKRIKAWCKQIKGELGI